MTTPGIRPIKSSAAPRRSTCSRSDQATVLDSGMTEMMMATGMKSVSASARTGDDSIPKPIPSDACTVVPTYTTSAHAMATSSGSPATVTQRSFIRFGAAPAGSSGHRCLG